MSSRFKQLFYLRRRDAAGAEAELRDKLESHVALAVDELVAQGIDPVEARRRARARFGDYDRAMATLAAGARTREKRMQRRERLGGVAQDLRYALVQLRRAPGHAAAVVVTLALAIGATTATFTLAREALWRDLPFTAPDRLVRVWAANPAAGNDRAPLSVPDFDDWRRAADASPALASLAAWSTLPAGLVLTGDGEPAQLRTAYVSDGFFATLGARALVGRTLARSDHVEGQDRVVVLSHALWRSRFGGDPDVVGRTIRLRDEPFLVAGVMPADMRYPEGVDLWAPKTVVPANGVPRTRGVRWLEVVARLEPGVAPGRAQADLGALARRLARDEPGPLDGWTEARVVPLAESISGGVRARLLLMLGAVGLVLVLGCVNVANLVLVRATSRAREMAVRAALGAGRARIARQLLVEQLVLAVAGGAIGLGIAWWGAAAVVRVTARWMPPVGDVRPDGTVLAFAAGLTLATGLVAGLLPATRRMDDAATMLRGARGASGGARTHAVRSLLVAAQVALAVTLVAGAGLLVKSISRLGDVSLGFDAEHTVSARMVLPSWRYATSEAYRPAVREMVERVRAIPGVTHASVAKDAPLRGAAGEELGVTLPGRAGSDAQRAVRMLPTAPGWLATMGVPLRAGRDLREPDDSIGGGIVVSEGLARQLWPGRGVAGALGEELLLGDDRLRVVGIAGDTRWTRVDSAATPMVYISSGLVRRRIVTIVARTTGDPTALVPALRAAIRAVNPDQAFQHVGPMRDALADATAAPRFLTLLVAGFGVLALLLAALGVYGVVAYVVGQRTRDIGVRVALGARARDVAGWALGTGMAPVAAGVVAGLVASLALARAIRAQLFEVSPTDPVVFGGVALVVVAVSLAATSLPARRAMRIDPVEALRRE
jgi:predicted permease